MSAVKVKAGSFGIRPERFAAVRLTLAILLPWLALGLKALLWPWIQPFVCLEIPMRRTDGQIPWMRIHSRPRRMPGDWVL